MKLARKVTGRSRIGAFTRAFHGVSLGALAATGNRGKRDGAGVSLDNVDRYPFDGYFGPHIDTIALIEQLLGDPSSGYKPPAAFIVETVQGEGGLNTASAEWLQALARLCREHGSLLIVDDIQAGCGRADSFFSFEFAGIRPDIICLSKSLSGLGLPLSMLVFRKELDVWTPGEHNGTFRGNNHAFVTGRAALQFWSDPEFDANRARLASMIDAWLDAQVSAFGADRVCAKGRGMMRGLQLADAALTERICAAAFQQGLLIETSGPNDEVLKIMPALTATPAHVETGLAILADELKLLLGLRQSELARA